MAVTRPDIELQPTVNVKTTKALQTGCVHIEQLFQFEPREVRRIFAGEYEIRYELNGQTIYVLRLWHTRENR